MKKIIAIVLTGVVVTTAALAFAGRQSAADGACGACAPCCAGEQKADT